MKKIVITAALIALVPATYVTVEHLQGKPVAVKKPLKESYVAAEGKVEALPGFDVNIGTGELNGKVGKILVKEGEPVTAGQVVAILQNSDLSAAVKRFDDDLAVAKSKLREIESGARPQEIKEAEAALQGAKATLEEASRQVVRYRTLQKQGMVSPADLDAKERAFEAAKAAVDEATQRKALLVAGPKPETVKVYKDQVSLAQTTLDYYKALLDKTYIRSPIDGVVIQRNLEEGEGITPEIPILSVANLDKIWINAEVDETDVGKIAVGEPVEIKSDTYPGTVFHGRIQRIADYVGVRKIRPSNPAVNLGLKVVQVKIALLEKTPLKLGMTVNVRIAAK